jgi:hypothetical protein
MIVVQNVGTRSDFFSRVGQPVVQVRCGTRFRSGVSARLRYHQDTRGCSPLSLRWRESSGPPPPPFTFPLPLFTEVRAPTAFFSACSDRDVSTLRDKDQDQMGMCQSDRDAFHVQGEHAFQCSRTCRTTLCVSLHIDERVNPPPLFGSPGREAFSRLPRCSRMLVFASRGARGARTLSRARLRAMAAPIAPGMVAG